MTWFTDDGCRFVGGLIATNFVQYHDATRNETFLQERVMPLLRGISDFYVSYAVPSNSSVFGPFGVRHGATGDEISLPFTCSQEVCHGGAAGAEHNAMQDLAYARMVWTKLLQYTDSDPTVGGERPAAATKAERAVWANSLRRLAPFQTVTAVVPGQPNRVSAAAPFDVCVFLAKPLEKRRLHRPSSRSRSRRCPTRRRTRAAGRPSGTPMQAIRLHTVRAPLFSRLNIAWSR